MADPIPNKLDVLYRTKITALNLSLSKRAKVVCVYPETVTQCPNCKYDHVHKSSLNVYNGTGPEPFTGNRCPVCRGVGQIKSVVRRRVQANVRYKHGDTDGNEYRAQGEILEGDAMIKLLVRDRAPVDECEYLLLDGVRYKKIGTPLQRGLKSYVIVQYQLKLDS